MECTDLEDKEMVTVMEGRHKDKVIMGDTRQVLHQHIHLEEQEVMGTMVAEEEALVAHNGQGDQELMVSRTP